MMNDEPKKEAPSAPPLLPKSGGVGKRPEGVPPQRFLLAWMAVLFFLAMTLWMVSGDRAVGGTRDISDVEGK